MMTFIVTANWTDQGIRSVKEAPRRVQAARAAAKKFGIEWKQFFLTSGDADMVLIVEAENGDSVAKLALAIGALGNIRTRIARAWTESEMAKLISELP